MSRGKLRWGDTLDDEDLLPPSVVKGPDDNGMKMIIDYYKNEKGDVMKKTTKIKVVTVEKKVYKVRWWSARAENGRDFRFSAKRLAAAVRQHCFEAQNHARGRCQQQSSDPFAAVRDACTRGRLLLAVRQPPAAGRLGWIPRTGNLRPTPAKWQPHVRVASCTF